jgi:NodT family efflux transporter outer membrane factor (OMF) lipoprotein
MWKTVMACLAISIPVGAGTPPIPKPNITIPSSFRNQASGAPERIAEQWWTQFRDPLLDRLIERAGRANLDVRKAASRLAESDALRKGARSALLPEITTSASAAELRGGFNQGVIKAPSSGSTQSGNLVSPFETSIVSGDFRMRWEIDVFGGLRKSLNAAGADSKAASENMRDVQAIVRSELARSYVDLRAAEDQIAIVRDHIASEKDLLDLTRARAEAGLASDLDTQRQIAQLASAQAALPDLDALRLQAIHRIGVLIGEAPSAVVDLLEQGNQRLEVPDAPRAVPGEVLKRRPDIRRAEAQIAAAYARAGAARRDLYPKFVITGLSGRQSTDFSGLTVGAGNFFSFGPGVTLPFLNFGKIRSQITARDAQLEAALRSFEQDVLVAFEETENAFVARDRAEQRRRDLETGVAAAKRSVELAQELYVRGLGDFLSVLDAQRQRFELERQLAATHAAVLRSTVMLYKALGG